MSKTRVYEWYKCFQDGCEDIDDDECIDCPSAHQQPKKMWKSGRNDPES